MQLFKLDFLKRVSFPWWIVLASLLEIRWPHSCGSLSGFSITKSVFPARVNSKHCRSHCFPDALICDLRYLPPTCMDQLSTKDSRDALCRSRELAFASFSLQGLTPILATFASPNSDSVSSPRDDYWFSMASSPAPCPANSSLETLWCRGLSHLIPFFSLMNESPYVARCPVSRNHPFTCNFLLYCQGPIWSLFFHQGQKRQSVLILECQHGCPIFFLSKFCTYYYVVF